MRPSLKALEFFAERLNVPASELLSARAHGKDSSEAELQAVEEDLNYQLNYVKMLIRTNQIDDALQLLDEAMRGVQPYWDKLLPSVQYLIPFVRGRAYLQLSDSVGARPYLEEALRLAKDDEDALARVHNLLGVIFYEQEQPHLALEHHLKCLPAVRDTVKDLNIRASVYRNLANDYWAIKEPSQAIGFYKETLIVLEDLNDLPSQAGVFWGMAMAYKTQHDWEYAKLYATRARDTG